METRMMNEAGEIRTVKIGFSWTMLFFGFLVPLVRGDWKWTFISFGLSLFSAGICWFVLPFVYNRIYIQGLIDKGWLPVDVVAAREMREKGIDVPGVIAE